jgi:SAM-dependent methyltransferase
MNFDSFSALIQSKWRLLSMPMEICLKKYGQVYREDAEWILEFLSKLTDHFGDDFDDLLSRYYNHVRGQTREQKEFSKTGTYRYCREADIANIIDDDLFKKQNLYILALSYLLSLHRYELLRYIKSFVDNRIVAGSRCLQVGTGIGLETYLADRHSARIASYDLNPYSSLCLELLGVSPAVRFFPEVYPFDEPGAFDHCLVVELLEHLEDPVGFLDRLGRVMKKGGDALLTFAIRMPQIDHIYCFRTVSQAREMVKASGLEVSGEEFFISSFLGFDESRKEELAESSQYAAVYACVASKP